MVKLQGRITRDGSDPATDAVVEIQNGQGDVVDQVQVDGDGRYRYHLSEGTWVLNVWDSHGHRGRREVPVGPDDRSIDIELSIPQP